MENKIKNILLIDDDKATNFINKKIIQKANIVDHIHVVLNGKEAIDYLCSIGEGNFDDSEYLYPKVIFLDINMPVMDGWEFIEAYKKINVAFKKDIKIVMLSSSVNPADKAKADSISEISEFRQKPLRLEVFLEIIDAYR